jgi:hypothetical protein
VEHEAVAVFAAERVDDLLVTSGTERGNDHGLRLATREQRGTVGARQHAVADVDRAHGARVATVDARLAVQDAAANDFRFQIEEVVLDRIDVRRAGGIGGQSSNDFVADFIDALAAHLLLRDAIRFLQLGFGHAGDGGPERFVARRCLPVPFGLAGHFHQFVDRIDRGLHLFVAEHDGAQHHFFRQLHRFGFNHQHGGFGAGDHQIQLAGLELRGSRIQDVLAIG